MTERIELIADKLVADWWSRAPYETLAGDLALHGIEDAYAVQAVVQEKLAVRRGPIAGRKIALSSKAMQDMVGIDSPAFGAFFQKDVHDSMAEIESSSFGRLGVECELALVMDRDIAPSVRVHTPGNVRGLIRSAHPAFELIEDRGADYTSLDAATVIADNAWCGGVVLGDEIVGWRERDLGDLPAVLYQTGHEPEEANTGAADPLGSLAVLLDHFAGRGITVGAGEVVITGSAVRTRFPAPGDHLRYEIAGEAVEMRVT